MSIREVVAERVSGIKKRSLIETPILEQIPRPARILSSVEMALAPTLGIVPVIVRGKVYGEVAGAWYYVTFPRTLNEPSVAAIGEGRGGVIPAPKAPVIGIAPVSVGVARTAITVPSVSIGIASAGVPKAATLTVREVRRGHIPTSLGRFSCGWAIAGLTDGLNDLVGTLESVLVRINEIVDDLAVDTDQVRSNLVSLDGKVNDLRDKVNAALESLRVNTQTATNSGLGTFRSNIESGVNDGLETLRRNTEGGSRTALDTLRKNTESAVNAGLAAVIPALYDAWGIPRNMAITPIHIRNVTSTGFEFQSFGETTCYYIAVGSLR